MARRDTNDNRYNRQVPNNTEIIYVHVDTAMGPMVEFFCVEDKIDIIAYKKGHPAGQFVADWRECKYNKGKHYTKNGETREEVIDDVSRMIKELVTAWHLREYFELQAAKKEVHGLKDNIIRQNS
jgi:hypothetical protein